MKRFFKSSWRAERSGRSWACGAALGLMASACVSAQVVSIEQAMPAGADAGLADSAEAVAVDLQYGWDSRYVSEGRDNLDGAGLWAGNFELGYQGLAAGAWYANGPDADYEELDAWLQYSHAIGEFELSLAYTYLEFLSDGANDHELGLGLEYGALPWNLSASALAYYSFDAAGTFFELGLAGEYEVLPWLTAGPYLVFGMNSGYIADGHNGANNLELGLAGEIPLNACWSITGHVSYNVALGADAGRHAGDELLKDFCHGGVGLQYSF